MGSGLFFLAGDNEGDPGTEDTCLLLCAMCFIPGSERCPRAKSWAWAAIMMELSGIKIEVGSIKDSRSKGLNIIGSEDTHGCVSFITETVDGTGLGLGAVKVLSELDGSKSSDVWQPTLFLCFFFFSAAASKVEGDGGPCSVAPVAFVFQDPEEAIRTDLGPAMAGVTSGLDHCEAVLDFQTRV